MQQTITTKDIGSIVNLKVMEGNTPVTAVVQAVEVNLVYKVVVDGENGAVLLPGELIL